jgi:hypothetical protein
LAKKNWFFTVVDEGTAKIVLKQNAFYKVLIQWKGRTLNLENWDIVDESEKIWKEPHHPFGGLRFYGLPGLHSIKKYDLRWWDLQQTADKKLIPQFHEKKGPDALDYVLLRPDVYWTRVERAETKPEERIPVTVDFLITMRVINPYKAIFNSPISWVENVINRLTAAFRAFIATKDVDGLIKLKSDRRGLWKYFENDPFIKTTLREEWGVQIDEFGIELLELDLSEYQRAVAAKREQELRSEGRVEETMGLVIKNIARAWGIPEEEVKEKMLNDPELRSFVLGTSTDMVVRKLGMESGKYIDIRVEGAEGLERTGLNLAALWRMLSPSGGTGDSGSKNNKEAKAEEGQSTGQDQQRSQKRKKSQGAGPIYYPPGSKFSDEQKRILEELQEESAEEDREDEEESS